MYVNGGFRLMLCCLAAVLAIAGCGSSKKSEAGSVASTPTQPTSTAAQPTTVANPYPKPHPTAHPGAKVETLIVKDVHKGTGPEIHAGDTGLFDFIGANYVTGALLEGQWRLKKGPFQTAIDHGVVIDGWWQGIPGMRVGGRRQIVIPPSLGFVNSVNPRVHGQTTYFDVVLRGVIPAKPAGVAGGGSSSAPTGTAG